MQAAKNVLIASFPNGFGTYESSQGCCSNSKGLGSDNGFLTGAVSMFDSTFNKGSSNIYDTSDSPYTLGWSDYLPSQYSNSLSGSGYSTYGNGVTYGVNGVFGLWVDIHNKHHTLANTAGTNSPNFTATMLNTVKKSNQLQVRSLVVLDSFEFSRQLENVTWNAMSFPVDDLLAQQSEVQQLAERNLEISAKPWSFYIEPRGSWGQVFKQKRHHGNTFQTAGTRAGFDYLWTNQHNQIPFCIGLGFVGDYLHLWGQRKHHSGKFFANEGLGNFYVTFVPKKIPELSVNLIGGGGYCWYTFHRDLFEDSKVIATGKSKGPEADMFFEIEYVFRHKRFSAIPKDFKIAPIAALQYTYSKINAYKETGAGRYNLHVNAQDASNLSTLLGFRTNYEFRSESDISIRPELMLLWQYQYLDPSITSTSSYLLSGIGPDLITATLPGIPHNTLIVGADLKLSIFEYAEVQIDYDFLYNSGFITNVFFLELKGKF